VEDGRERAENGARNVAAFAVAGTAQDDGGSDDAEDAAEAWEPIRRNYEAETRDYGKRERGTSQLLGRVYL